MIKLCSILTLFIAISLHAAEPKPIIYDELNLTDKAIIKAHMIVWILVEDGAYDPPNDKDPIDRNLMATIKELKAPLVYLSVKKDSVIGVRVVADDGTITDFST